MEQKLKVAAKKSRRLKHKLFLLKNSIAEQQQKVAHLSDDCLEKISKNEKLVVQEIISAARKKDPRGRRYTDDFIMLCMLMNIRSTSYYEFLRANNIIPLPCTRTIREYMRRFTSTVPARGARASNRAISNSCL